MLTCSLNKPFQFDRSKKYTEENGLRFENQLLLWKLLDIFVITLEILQVIRSFNYESVLQTQNVGGYELNLDAFFDVKRNEDLLPPASLFHDSQLLGLAVDGFG